ncbi:MAG: hypothetical protein GIW95_11575 [Candidatus Eremiobacteraeota bacterium]|nr:hypothetical protein [Candidatus Eremiobacteraeota bacterium]
MKAIAAIWEFIAGDSKRAPLAVAAAVAVAIVLLRSGTASGAVAIAFAGIIAAGLAASVFERT